MGKDFIICQSCDECVSLMDHIERRLASDPVAREVMRMDEAARQGLDVQALEQILIGHLTPICGEADQLFRLVPGSEFGLDGEIEFKDKDGNPSGSKVQVLLRRGDAVLRERAGGLPRSQDEPAYLSELHTTLARRFNDGELRTVCLNLGVEYEDLPAVGRADKARELLEYLNRRQRIPDLVRLCRHQRPDIAWDDVPASLAGTTQVILEAANPKHVEAWARSPDVYLVMRDAEETIRWMNLTEHLNTRKDKRSRLIVFDGEKLDASAVWRARSTCQNVGTGTRPVPLAPVSCVNHSVIE